MLFSRFLQFLNAKTTEGRNKRKILKKFKNFPYFSSFRVFRMKKPYFKHSITHFSEKYQITLRNNRILWTCTPLFQ